MNNRVKFLFRLFLMFLLVSILCILGGFWYWAIFGIKREIGTALGITSGIFAVLALITWLNYEEMQIKGE